MKTAIVGIGLILIVFFLGMVAWDAISDIGFEIGELYKEYKEKKGIKYD